MPHPYSDPMTRPDRLPAANFDGYHMIRLYSRDYKKPLEHDPKEFTLDDLKVTDGAILCIWEDTELDEDWYSYFVVIKTHVDEKYEWEKSKYLRVDKLWDPPNDEGRNESYEDALDRTANTFIETALSKTETQDPTVQKFWGHAISLFNKEMPQFHHLVQKYEASLGKAWWSQWCS
ncbi:hypothetical protein XPA_008190 [Xanthoria parietina]